MTEMQENGTEGSSADSDRNKNDNTPRQNGFTLVNLAPLLENLVEIWNNINEHKERAISYIMCDLGGYEIRDSLMAWCARNPHLTMLLVAAASVFLLPVLIVFGLGISAIVLTFTGILMFEGTIVTFVSIAFCGCLLTMGLILAILVFFAVAVYFGFMEIYGFYGNLDRHRESLLRYIQSRRVINKPLTNANTIENVDSATT